MKTFINILFGAFILLFIYSFFVPAISYYDIETGYNEPIIFFGIIPNLIVASTFILRKIISQETKFYAFLMVLSITGVFALVDELSTNPLYQNILEGYWWWFTASILIMLLIVIESSLLNAKGINTKD